MALYKSKPKAANDNTDPSKDSSWPMFVWYLILSWVITGTLCLFGYFALAQYYQS